MRLIKAIKRFVRRRRRVLGLPTLTERKRDEIAAALQRAVLYIDGEVDGDVAEFGTRFGETASIIANSMADRGQKAGRKLWLFDSFEGLPRSTAEADAANPLVRSGTWGEGTMRGLSPLELREVIGRFLPSDSFIIHAGWFADTLPRVPDTAHFAMIHVDADLYQSAIDCLAPLFERGLIADGAVILFDDWNAGAARNGLGERRAWREITEHYAVDFEDIGGHSSHGRSFIVHSYRRPAVARLSVSAIDTFALALQLAMLAS